MKRNAAFASTAALALALALALAATPGCFHSWSDECGDGVCRFDEDWVNCPEDCWDDTGSCGDGVCLENCTDCPADCGDCGDCIPDGICAGLETCTSCPGDCCGSGCGDGACDPPVEACGTPGYCPVDCGDCGVCGNGICEPLAGEGCVTCAWDCPACPTACGNDLCELGESCENCARECLCFAPGVHEAFPGADGPDLAGTALRFSPDGGGYFQDWACIAGLPVVPGSGTVASYTLALANDDDAPMIAFPFGVPFFGVVQSTAWVSANGHLTFYAADAGSSYDVAGHYAVERIAPLRANLSSGTIVIDESPGRLTITWVDWVAAGAGPGGAPATFQVSLEPSGEIEMAYGEELDIPGAVVGLSDGSAISGTALDLAPGGCTTEYGSPGIYQQFFGANDLSGVQITYLWTGTGYIVWSTPGHSTLPEGIGGGTVENGTYFPGDDLAIEVDLVGSFPFFGAPYSTVWMSPNGYLNFDESSSSYSESATEHFSHVQLSMLFDDFNPAINGILWMDEYGDHLTITYDAFSEFGKSTSNTFQVTMFDDGLIVVTYLAIEATDGLAGLSDGNPGALPLPAPVDLAP